MTRLPAELAAAREASLAVRCTDCGADIGQPCPLQHFAAHPARLRDAGIRLRPVTDAETRDPRPLTRTAARAVDDTAARRLHELRCDARAGQLTETERAELLRLEQTLHQQRNPDPDATWIRGQGAR